MGSKKEPGAVPGSLLRSWEAQPCNCSIAHLAALSSPDENSNGQNDGTAKDNLENSL
jgi:hypothetical protein